MRTNLVAIAPFVVLATAGCFDGVSTAPCQTHDNYCDGDVAHSCESAEQGSNRFTTRCDAKTQACIGGYCSTLTDVPCDPAGDVCDPSGRSAYKVCAKGFYTSEIPCGDGEACTIVLDSASGKNYAGCAITPFETCTPARAFCRDNRVLSCDETLGLLTLWDDCGTNRTCNPSTTSDAHCF
jgi:hypothetical protein